MIGLPQPARTPAPVVVAPTRRVDWVDIAKGIAMLLVVLYHVCLVLVAKHLAPSGWNQFNGVLEPLRMPLFMLTSGLFAQKMIRMAWVPVLRTRVALMLYLYAVWLVMFCVVHNLLPDDVRHKGYAHWSNLVTGLYFPANALWYLYALAIFIVAAKLLSRMPVYAQLALALALSFWVQYDHFLRFPYTNFFEYFLYFMIGLHLRELVLGFAHRSTGWHVAIGTAAYAGLIVLKSELHFPALKVAVSIVGILTAVAAARRLEGTHLGEVTLRIGESTLPIFLMFDMWIAAWTWVFLRLPEFLGAPLVVTVLTVTAAMVTHRILLRAHIRWLFELPTMPSRRVNA